MIRVENFVKKYDDLTVVNHVFFRVKRGSITGLIGESGSGKSTIIRGILGLTPMDCGSAMVYDLNYRSIVNPSQSIGVVLDTNSLHPFRTGYTIMKISALLSGTSLVEIDEILTMCGISKDLSKKMVKTYSLVEKQRLCFAQALLAMPSILIIDEPIKAMDSEGITWMRSLLKDFSNKGGTVLITTRSMCEMETIADHIVMIKNGKIVEDDSTENLLLKGINLEEIYMKSIGNHKRGYR